MAAFERREAKTFSLRRDIMMRSVLRQMKKFYSDINVNLKKNNSLDIKPVRLFRVD